MDSSRKKTKPTSYRGTFRRYWWLLCLPLVLGVAGAAFFVVQYHKTYRSDASLWVDTAPPNTSSVGAGAASLPTTPAAGEQTLLSELLTTNAFAVSVAQNSLLGSSLGSQAEIELKAASELTSTQVGSLVSGPQVLALSYTGSSAALATSTLRAIVKQLIADSQGLSQQHDQALVAYYQSMLAAQSKVLAAARARVDAYLAKHPHATTQSDPNFSALMAAQSAASQQLGQTNSALSQASGSRNGGGWSVRVIDQPSAAQPVVLGKKKMLEVLLAGLFGGALISFLGVVALTPTRKPEPWEDELLESELLAADRISEASRKGLLPTGAEQGPALRYAGEGRFDFGAHDDDID